MEEIYKHNFYMFPKYYSVIFIILMLSVNKQHQSGLYANVHS